MKERLTAKDKALLALYEADSNYRLYDRPESGRHRAKEHRLRNTLAVMAVLMTAALVSFEPSSEEFVPMAAAAPSLDSLAPSLLDQAVAAPDPMVAERVVRRNADRADRARRATRAGKSVLAASRVEVAVQYALAQVGKRYVWGTKGPRTYDCSGLTMAAFARIGIKLPHYSGAQLNYGQRVARSQLKRGDIVWPHGGHVGIYLGNGKMVHAANPGDGIIVSSVYSFWTARRLL